MHSFPVPVLGLAVRFFSPFLASLPQLFHECLPSLSLRSFPLLFRFLSSASFPVPATQPSVSSFPFFPFLPHSGFFGAPFPLSLPGFLHSFLPDFSCILSWFPYSAFCWFPFVLPCFAPAAVPQVIPFWSYPPGPTPDFRFLSSASILAPHYSASVSSFPLFPFPPHSGFSGAPLPLTLLRSSPFIPAWFPKPSSRFIVLGFLLVSFRPSRSRSRSCSTGACLALSPSAFFPIFRFLSSASFRS